MDIETMFRLLEEAAESKQGKYIPWWEDDFETCEYIKNIFTSTEIQEITECAASCKTDVLSAPGGTYGYTLFHLLVWHNFYKAAKQALENGIDANLTDGNGRGVTPLLFACSRGNLAMAELLLSYGADASRCDAKSRNGFHYLAHPYAEGLQILEDVGYSLDQRAAIARLLSGTISAADINQKDINGIPPLVYLVDGGSGRICCTLVSIYLEIGADPYFIDDNDGTLLLRAIMRRRITPALALMEYKELVNQATKQGITPLMAATEKLEEGLCIALKDHGAEGPCELAEVDEINLGRIANNAFVDAFGQKKYIDMTSLGFYLTKKLVGIAKEDEDYGCLEYIIDDAMMDEKARILDVLYENGVDFTEPYYGGSDNDVSCLRDKFLEYCRNDSVIQKLTGFGVDMEHAVISGKTPACILAGNRRGCGSEVYRMLPAKSMEQLDNRGCAAIHYAILNNHINILEEILKQNVNVNLAQDAPAETCAGDTPLHLACIYGRIDAAKLLMSSGADDSVKNIKGESPAHYLIIPNLHRSELSTQERKDLLELLEHIDIARNDGKTPLMLLMSLHSYEIDKKVLLQLLLAKGADVNRTDLDGNTALLLYTQEHGGNKDLVKMLVQAGANLNAVDCDGNSALHHILYSGSQDAASYLIRKGADYRRPNNDGVSPAQIAAEKGYDTLFRLMTDL